MVNAFAYVVTPPIESRLETVKEVLSLVVCLCKVGATSSSCFLCIRFAKCCTIEALAKALWDKDMVPAIAKLCYAQHRKVYCTQKQDL